MKKKDDFIYDVRVSERHIKEGIIAQKDYDKYLNNLPDMVGNSEPLIIEDDNEQSGVELDDGDKE